MTTKPKVLIEVRGGCAYYTVEGEVDVELIDYDNLEAEIDDCPICNAPCNGPVPNYCREHDGDYSSWLVSNNID